jgi:hypothetical protein
MIQSIRIPAAALLDGLPDPWPENLQPRIEAAVRRSHRKVFVVVFPGNVGDDRALLAVVEALESI